MATTDLHAGVGRVTITPPVGIPMTGFAGRGVSAGLHDDLVATALVIERAAEGGAQLALIACDLLVLREDKVHAVRAAVSRLTGIAPHAVVVACSHTHYGPTTNGLTAEADSAPGAAQVQPYLANLVFQLAGAVALARNNSVPCTLGVGEGEARIGVNRRERTADGEIILGENPGGPCDHRVFLLRVDGVDGRPIAAVLNHACHPVSLGAECTHLSADFPGVARRLVEEQTGATCLFVQGAAGNINPILMGLDWSYPVRLGLPMGAEAVRIYWAITPRSDSQDLKVEHSRIDLPPLLPASVSAASELVATLESEHRRALEAEDRGGLWWAKRRLDRARRGLEAVQGGEAIPPIPAEITAVRLADDVGAVTAPGEIFTEIGQAIVRQSPFPHTLYLGYANGSIGYVPTRSAYAEGGYEVTHECFVAANGGELIERESVRLLHQVHQSGAPR